ncbi:Riboflavin biosynthesis protein RibF [Corynebacterium ciconiae DSM 44920]|uniref:bifunctional riboflavin kinase/FAD synthetase n=1 Tax=Corynebacterium ciconiae TaxID=227319 RepID=UPI000366F658|nr:bifunctional riboflavin kinase/FAD synthetase [Corynebacterium ciconiae]WKD61435.1 Riboflavin biosynthesis protein RibF [Corynebacterium ciconiae DSM 44920]
MNIWHGLDSIPAQLDASVVTIGVFDGIHSGHQTLLRRAAALAAERDVPAVLMTFDPHPLAVVRPDKMPPLLGSVEDRAEIAASLGIDHLLALRFDASLAQLSPEDFFSTVVLDTLGAKAVVVGENFTFGHKAAGTTETLRELGQAHGVDVVVLPLLNEAGAPISSTRIRGMLERGDIAEANAALTRNFAVRGEVQRGAGRGGRELGFPTANLYFPPSQALPVDGVYAGYFTVLDSTPTPGDMECGVRYPAAISVGNNPTFDDPRRSVETFVLDREADLYGHTVRVEFVDYVRGMEKFTGVEELLDAIRADVAATRAIVPEPIGC